MPVFIYSKHISLSPAVMLHCHGSAVQYRPNCAAVGAWVWQKLSTRSSRLLAAEYPAQSKRLRYGGGGAFQRSFLFPDRASQVSVHPISTPPVSTPAWGCILGESWPFRDRYFVLDTSLYKSQISSFRFD